MLEIEETYMENRYTLRIFDGMTHYDFPSYESSDRVYHSLISEHPIRAVHDEKGSKCEILRSVSSEVTSGHIISKMNWSKKWRLQLYYNNDGRVVVTGSDMTVFEPDNIKRISVIDKDVAVDLSPEKQKFNITGATSLISGEDYNVHPTGSEISSMYNADSTVVFLNFDERVRVEYTEQN